MMEVTIHWASLPGEGQHRYLVDVPSVGGRGTPNPFDHVQADIAIDSALKAFREMGKFESGYTKDSHGRTITRIDLRQTEDVVIPGVAS